MSHIKLIVLVREARLGEAKYGVEINPLAKVSDIVTEFASEAGISSRSARLLVELKNNKTLMEQVPVRASTRLVLLVDNW